MIFKCNWLYKQVQENIIVKDVYRQKESKLDNLIRQNYVKEGRLVMQKKTGKNAQTVMRNTGKQ